MKNFEDEVATATGRELDELAGFLLRAGRTDAEFRAQVMVLHAFYIKFSKQEPRSDSPTE